MCSLFHGLASIAIPYPDRHSENEAKGNGEEQRDVLAGTTCLCERMSQRPSKPSPTIWVPLYIHCT